MVVAPRNVGAHGPENNHRLTAGRWVSGQVSLAKRTEEASSLQDVMSVEASSLHVNVHHRHLTPRS